MQLMPNSFSFLVTVSFTNMALATEKGTYPTKESSVPMTLKSMIITETTEESTSGLANEYLNVTENPKREFTEYEGLLSTATEFDNSTEESDSGIDNTHSSFNLAIIPAVAVFVFIIITCIKCCKWFRQYTRGGHKNENFYAVIITDDEKYNGLIDITLESASTVYYDTIPSHASFLDRSGNSRTLSSKKAWRQESNSCTSSWSKKVKKSVEGEPDMKPFTSCSNRKTQKDEAIGDFDVRMSSISSTETVSEQINESPASKRNNRFRVSFITEAKSLAPEFRTQNGNIKHEKVIRSNLKKSSSTSPETPLPSDRVSMETKMVDVGTQTNKSFRYSLRKSKGHVSESDLDERLFCRKSTSTLAFQSEESQCKDDDDDNLRRNSDNDSTKASKRVKHSSVSLEEERICSHSTGIPEISKYPLDTNVEVINTCKETKESNEDLDDDDDVFIEDMGKDSTPCSNKDRPFDLNVSLETCNNTKKRCVKNVFVGLTQPETFLCSHCKTKLYRNIVEPICDDGVSQVLGIDPVIQNICEKCKLLYKQKQKLSYETRNDKTDELLIENEGKFVKMDDRPASMFSLESSGYAELSSSESSSSSP